MAVLQLNRNEINLNSTHVVHTGCVLFNYFSYIFDIGKMTHFVSFCSNTTKCIFTIGRVTVTCVLCSLALTFNVETLQNLRRNVQCSALENTQLAETRDSAT